jgi:peptidoglycan/LPS O-acetylase OafA/YrhL
MLSNVGTSKRLDFLDCLRGIAALCVVFEHGGDHSFAAFRGFTHGIFSLGKFGVAVFFLTSGFVIPLSLERTGSLKQFWIGRFFRLYPLYWFCLIAAVVFTLFGIGEISDPHFGQHLLRNAAVNITMLQGLLRIPNAEGLYYTLTMELIFYVAFSILFILHLNRKSLQIAWAATVFLAIVGIGVPLVFDRRVPLAGLFYFLNLAIGTVIYRAWTGAVSHRALFRLIAAYSLLTAVEIFCNYVLIKKDDPVEVFSFAAVAGPWLGAAALFVFFFMKPFRFPKGLIWLGMISYSLYLLHPFFLLLVPSRFAVASFLTTIIASLLVSSATYWLIERPSIEFGKRLRNGSTNRPRPLLVEDDAAEAAIAI